ncbi:MAG: hypothetical protein IB618_03950 [Candidatus Pacearchaeota archaeon]|nr:MAG: hypothetical protein IB618_03950 [Candidatus Pacearchaeota archaeon]
MADICENCKKAIKDDMKKLVSQNDSEENIYFCSWKCHEEFEEKINGKK